MAAACADGAVVEVDASDGEVRERARHRGGALCLGISSQGLLACGGEDGRVGLVPGGWLDCGDRWVQALAWSPTGGLLAAAEGRRVQLWSPAGERRAVSANLAASVTCLGWHPQRRWVAAGSYGGVVLLSSFTLELVDRLPWKGSVLELAFSPDGRRLAHGNQDASVHFWELATHRELEMQGYERKVRELAWSPDGRWLATGGGDAVVVWDFAGRGPAGSAPVELESHRGPISALAFQPRGVLLASAARDGLVHLWHPEHDDLPLASVALDDELTALAWSPLGTLLAVGGAGGTLAVLAAS